MKGNEGSIQLGLKRPRNEINIGLQEYSIWSQSLSVEYANPFINTSYKDVNPSNMPNPPLSLNPLSFLPQVLSLKGGAKSKKRPSTLNKSPTKKQKKSEPKPSTSKLNSTTSPKMKKKTSYISISFADESIDLTQYTTPMKKSSSPRKSPRSPSRKVKFDLDQNTVLEFDKKNVISRSKKTLKSKSSKSILKVRVSPRRNKSP
jgi:hypothetical protein